MPRTPTHPIITQLRNQSDPSRRAILRALVSSLSPAERFLVRTELSVPALAIDLLTALPPELAAAVVALLDLRSLGRAEQVSSRWAGLVSASNEWRARFLALSRANAGGSSSLHAPPAVSPMDPHPSAGCVDESESDAESSSWSPKLRPSAAAAVREATPYKNMTRRRIGAERAWESGSPTFVARLKGHTDKVTAAKFVAVPGVRPATGGASFYLGKWSDKHSNITYISEPPLLITASFDNSIRIWHLHPPTPLLIVETPHSVSCMDADVLREGAPRDDDEGTRPMVQALRVVIGSYLGTATLVVIEVVHRPVRAFEFGPAQATEFRLRTIRSLGQVSGSPISKVVLWGSWALVASAGGVKAVHIHKNDVGAVNVAAPVRTDSSGLCIMNVFSTENTIKDVLPITVASPDASHSRSFLFILAQVAPNTRSASPGSNGVTVLDVTEFTHASESRPPMDPKIVSSTILDASVNESGVALYAGRSGTDTTVTVVRKNATRFSSHVSDLLSSVPATAQQQGDSPPWRLLPSDFRSEADSINTCAYDRGRAVWLRTRSWGWWDDAPVMMEGEGGDSVWKRWGRAPRTQDTLECVALDGDLVAVGTGNGFVDVVGFGVEVERA